MAWNRLWQRTGLDDDQWQNQLNQHLLDVRRDDPERATDIESRLNLTSDESFETGLDSVIEGIATKFLTDLG